MSSLEKIVGSSWDFLKKRGLEFGLCTSLLIGSFGCGGGGGGGGGDPSVEPVEGGSSVELVEGGSGVEPVEPVSGVEPVVEPVSVDESISVKATLSIPEDMLINIGESSSPKPSSKSYISSAPVMVNDVPWMSQLLDKQDWEWSANCGPASYLLVESSYNKSTPTQDKLREIIDKMWAGNHNNYYGGESPSLEALVNFAKGRGFDAEAKTGASLVDLTAELTKGHPVVVLVRNQGNNDTDVMKKWYESPSKKAGKERGGHYMVLVGLDNDYAYFNDPGRGSDKHPDKPYSHKYTLNSFLDIWKLGGTYYQSKNGFVAIAPKISSAPISPAAFITEGISSSEVRLSWIDSSINEDGFRVERKQEPNGFFRVVYTAELGGTTFNDSGLLANTTYTDRVTAFNGFGDSPSFISQITTLPNINVPSTPSNISATANSANQIQVNWADLSNNETGFKIERKLIDETSFNLVAYTEPGVTTFNDTNLVPSLTATYRVRASNDSGHSDYTTTASATTQTSFNLPNAPTTLTAISTSSNTMGISWLDNSSDETAFKIERSLDDIIYEQIATVGPNNRTYTDKGLAASTNYYYRVSANNPSGDSAYTNKANAVTASAEIISGILDTTFAGTGYTTYNNSIGAIYENTGRAVAIDTNGRTIVLGRSKRDDSYNMTLLCYNQDGTLDTAFGKAGVVTFDKVGFSRAYGYGVTVDAQGRIVVVGAVNNPSGGDALAVWRYNPNGTLDNTFNDFGYAFYNDGPYSGHIGQGVAVDKEGRIIVTGMYKSGVAPGNNLDMGIWRYTSNGSLDTTFNGKGFTTHHGAPGPNGTDIGSGVAIDANGKIVVCGTCEEDANGRDMFIWRYNTDGTLDTSFNGVGYVSHNNAGGSTLPDDFGSAIALDKLGRIVVAGRSNALENGDSPDMVVWRYNPNGSLDTSFNGKGFFTHNNAAGANAGDGGYALALDSLDRIVVAGWSQGTLGGYKGDMVTWRLNQDGSLDSTFGSGGYVLHHNAAGGDGVDIGYGVAIDKDGKIVIVGDSSTSGNSKFDFAIWRYK